MNKLKALAVLPLAAGAVFLGAGAAHAAAASITVSPSTVPATGGTVTVTGSGFPAKAPVAFLECSATSTTDCDLGGVTLGTADASGKVNLQVKVKTGKIGSGGKSCNAGDTCYIGGGTQDQSVQVVAKFTFAAAASESTPTSAAPTSAAPTSSAPAATDPGTTTAPAVNAGSGGAADREGVPTGVLLLAVGGAVAVAGGAVRLARR